jgi:hypothetical protein
MWDSAAPQGRERLPWASAALVPPRDRMTGIGQVYTHVPERNDGGDDSLGCRVGADLPVGLAD